MITNPWYIGLFSFGRYLRRLLFCRWHSSSSQIAMVLVLLSIKNEIHVNLNCEVRRRRFMWGRQRYASGELVPEVRADMGLHYIGIR